MAVVEDFDFRTSRGCLESQHFLENSTGAQENDNKNTHFTVYVYQNQWKLQP